MDIVLEICDYYMFDRIYGTLLPKGGTIDQFISNLPIINQLSSYLQLPKSPIITYNGFNSTNTITNQINFNTTNLNFTTLFTYILQKLSNYQNKCDIYGLKPNFLPSGDYFHSSFLERSNILRESLSILIVTTIFGWVLYFITAYLSYLFVFDKKIFNHPRYLKNQMSLEIERAVTAIPIMVALTNPFFLLELNGFSKLYMNINDSTGGWKFLFAQIPMFILFTDCLIYFIHRWLHWPSVYKRLHKPHHKWIVCTPFASHAFHPIDGWAQSLPYHIYPLLFPLHKVLYLFLFTFVNFWTVMIHDGNYMSNDPVVNGTACHTVHHLYFNYNYGQFTTLWDRIGNSYRRPDDSFFIKDNNDLNTKKMWKNQVVQMEEIRGELEGKVDDREYVEE
ncbi:ERG3 [Candida pseudojiufengensis]|uniref:ERG3 n=1 Tax=Candida pseudojiufengensis TaxID=497109 RepID=UPI002223EFB4|nr:ERG3 [Candida pseudojiufengensis]KAI5966527.1 ERG3 [Candida pseudojiufengensis]